MSQAALLRSALTRLWAAAQEAKAPATFFAMKHYFELARYGTYTTSPRRVLQGCPSADDVGASVLDTHHVAWGMEFVVGGVKRLHQFLEAGLHGRVEGNASPPGIQTALVIDVHSQRLSLWQR